jgi:hypothetical protein
VGLAATVLVALFLSGFFLYGMLKVANGWLASGSEPPPTRAILRQFFGGWALHLLVVPTITLWTLGVLGQKGVLAGLALMGFGFLVWVHALWKGRRDPRFQSFDGRWLSSRTGRID